MQSARCVVTVAGKVGGRVSNGEGTGEREEKDEKAEQEKVEEAEKNER